MDTFGHEEEKKRRGGLTSQEKKHYREVPPKYFVDYSDGPYSELPPHTTIPTSMFGSMSHNHYDGPPTPSSGGKSFRATLMQGIRAHRLGSKPKHTVTKYSSSQVKSFIASSGPTVTTDSEGCFTVPVDPSKGEYLVMGAHGRLLPSPHSKKQSHIPWVVDGPDTYSVEGPSHILPAIGTADPYGTFCSQSKKIRETQKEKYKRISEVLSLPYIATTSGRPSTSVGEKGQGGVDKKTLQASPSIDSFFS